MGCFCISVLVIFGVYVLGLVVVVYMQQYLDVQVDLNLFNSLVDIVEDGYDLVFCIGDLVDSGLVVWWLGLYLLVLCVLLDYLVLCLVIIYFNDLSWYECLGFVYLIICMCWSFCDVGGSVLIVLVFSCFMVNQVELLLIVVVGGLGLILQFYEMFVVVLVCGELVEVFLDYVLVLMWINLVYLCDCQLMFKLCSFLDFCVVCFSEQMIVW